MNQGSEDKLAVSKFIRATQKRDYKAMVDYTYSSQSEIARIKKQNPKALWGRLLDEYYKKEISSLSDNRKLWGSPGPAAMWGLIESVSAAIYFLPPSCKWTILESRTQNVNSFIRGSYIKTDVYIEVNYPRLEESPEIYPFMMIGGNIEWTPEVNQKYLKQTILGITVRDEKYLVTDVYRMSKADVYWTKPYPATAMPFLSRKYKSAFEVYSQQNKNADAMGAINRLVNLGWKTADPVLLDILSRGDDPGCNETSQRIIKTLKDMASEKKIEADIV